MKKKLLTPAVLLVLAVLFAFAANDFQVPFVKTAHGSDWCEAHQIRLSKCEKCNPKLARGGTTVAREREPKEGECPNTLVRITLAPGVADRLGIDPKPIEARTLSETIKANAETLYVPMKYARIAPRVAGVVLEPKVLLGQKVDEGATLAFLESAEFGRAKADYLQALDLLDLRQKTFEQEDELFRKKITAGRELLQAKTQLEEAKLSVRQSAQKLAAFGLSAEQIREIEAAQKALPPEGEKERARVTSPLLEVKSPFTGIVVEASAVRGETAGPEKAIFAIADVKQFWLSIDVYEADIPKIEKDQLVSFSVEGIKDKDFPGKIVAVGSEVDDRTRTVRVYAEVENVQRFLRAKMFGRAAVTIQPPEAKILIPKDAVHYDGDCYLVFVSPATNLFQAKKVEIRNVYEGWYEIGGLASDAKVVTTGSFLLKTEILRGQMGAG